MVSQNPGVLTVDNEEVAEESFSNMNALALGVEAKYDLLSGYSRTVTEVAIEIARKLSMPEREIRLWKIARSALHPGKRIGNYTPLT